MKAGFGYSLLLVLLFLGAVCGAPRRVTSIRKPAPGKGPPPSVRKPSVPQPEPKEPTDFPPPILGPPSAFTDCPRECSCPTSFPEALYCENRNLRTVPTIPARTQYLYIQNNYITEVTAEPFQNATQLRWVNMDNNRIRKVERQVFEKIPNLLFLYLGKNNLKEVPSDLPNSLEQLKLSRNLISKIPASSFSKLKHLALLDLHHNKLGDGALSKNIFKDLKNLVQLNLAHNTLKKMPSNVPQNIFQLFLDRNNIEDIPKDYFRNFPNLAFVRLNYNQLTDKGIPNNVFNVSSLLNLHLAHNKLNNVPNFNYKLEHLYLNNNSIDRINGTELCPFSVMSTLLNDEDLPRLSYLRLDGNHLSPPIPMDVIMCFRRLTSIVI